MSKQATFSGVCTLMEDRKPFQQKWYTCLDCDLEGICAVCAQFCHSGHKLSAAILSEISCVCSLKSKEPCKCWDKNMDELEKARDTALLELEDKIQEILEQPLRSFSLGADLLRLGSKVAIFSQDGTQIFPEQDVIVAQVDNVLKASSRNPIENARNLLSLLFSQFNIDDTTDSYFSQLTEQKLVDPGRCINDFIVQLGESHLIVKFLKASCNQAIISPPYLNLKLNVLKDFSFKDAKQWSIFIFFSDSSVTVVHKKKERGVNATSQKDEFSFVWEMKLVFPLQMDSISESMYGISDLKIIDMENDRSNSLRSLSKSWRFKGFLVPSSNALSDFIGFRSRLSSPGNAKSSMYEFPTISDSRNEIEYPSMSEIDALLPEEETLKKETESGKSSPRSKQASSTPNSPFSLSTPSQASKKKTATRKSHKVSVSFREKE
eukprot:TRINITY_DN7406_c0_g1_i10.p1 TRINITY_DN7406_c0_g1~~TRINITY_DN7406_c0_g1_i10.p1  ORF type:complete len:435 (-),score=93.07 TRINITY_DN7406_c0_g1_i10:88-1392(-)